MGFTGRPRGRVLASSIIIDAWVSDGWRWLGGLVCDNRPVRQDLLDEVVWKEVVRLLEDKSLIEGELDRRLKAARNADPTQRREDTLRRDLARCRKCIERAVAKFAMHDAHFASEHALAF